MDALLKRLDEASYDGDIDKLKQLLEENPLLLDKVLTEVRDNPLHIAALKGHVDFTREVLRLKEELASQLNREGQSPLHLAAARGHLQVAKILADKVGNNNTCLIRESNHGYMPVHTAAINGRHDIVKMLVERCRETLQVVTNKRESLLHLAVMANCLDCVCYLIDEHALNINENDEDGNTCMHLAAAKRNRQMMTYLLDREGIKINSRNEMHLTPLDVLVTSSLGSAVDISLVDTIRSAEGKRSKELSDLESNTSSSVVVGTPPRSNQRLSRQNKNMTSQKLSSDAQTLLIVATLVVTMTFQAITNPPGGFIQPIIEKNNTLLSSEFREFDSSWLIDWQLDNLFPAGRPVLLFQLTPFFILDSIALLSSVSVILWLLIAEPKTKIVMKFLVAIVWFSAFCTALAFVSGFIAIYASPDLGPYLVLNSRDIYEFEQDYSQRYKLVLGLLCAIFGVYVLAGLWATVIVISFLWRKAGFKRELPNWIAKVCCLKDSTWFKRIFAKVSGLKGSTRFRKIYYGILIVCAVGAFAIVTAGVGGMIYYVIFFE